MATNFHAVTVDTIHAVLTTFIAANPTLLKAAFKTRPSSYTDLPLAYIGPRSEAIDQNRSVRMRVLTTSVRIVDHITDNVQTMGRQDVLVDALLDAFTAAMRDIPLHGPLSLTGTESEEEGSEGGAFYSIEVIGLQAETQEGTGL